MNNIEKLNVSIHIAFSKNKIIAIFLKKVLYRNITIILFILMFVIIFYLIKIKEYTLIL